MFSDTNVQHILFHDTVGRKAVILVTYEAVTVT